MKYQDCLLMSKEIKNKIVPKLRFPKFRNGEEWQMKTMEEVAPLQRGFDLPAEQIKSGPIPVIYSNGIRNFHNVGMAKGPGLVTGRSGTIGEIHFIEAGTYWPHNTSLWVTSFKGNSPKFIYFLYKSIGLKRFASGSGVPTLNRNDVHAFQVYIPKSLEEQQKIADCLSSLDDFISAQNQKLEELKAHKKGLMQQLFPTKGEAVPRLRFEKFRKAGEWKKKEFDEILEITRLAGYEYSEYWEEDPNKEIIALRGYNIGKGKLELNNLGYISNNLSFKLIRSRLFKGDIVYPCVGTIGNAVVIDEDNKYHIQQNIAKLTPKKGTSPYFISQFLMSDLGMNEVYRFNATSSQPNVLVGSLRKFELYVPDYEEQQKIAECLTSLDKLITAQTEKIEGLKIHKKGLVQQMFPAIDNIRLQQ